MAEYPITYDRITRLTIHNELGQWSEYGTGERIVRCEDCKHSKCVNDALGGYWLCLIALDPDNTQASFMVEPGGFCAWGEER